MTPRVLGRELEAARLRATDRFKEGLADAWNVARMYAAVKSKKGLQPLSKVLDEVKDGSTGKQTAADMKANVEYLSKLSGVPLRRGGKIISG
jgi:hypothetical protein